MKKLKNLRVSDIISALGLLVIIYALAASHFILPDKTFSEQENRVLQTFPKLSPESLTNGDYTKKISKWCTDQMPLRDMFVGIKAVSEIGIGKTENNSVILAGNGNIVAKNDYADRAAIDTNVSALHTFADRFDGELRIAIAPRAQDVLCSKIPSIYPAREISDADFAYLNTKLEGLETADLLSPLRTMADAGDYVYYRTDHHWTSLGAYCAYAEIMRSYAITPYEPEYFTREVASENFYGTTWSKAGMKWIAPDTIEFFRFPGDSSLVTEIADNGRRIDGLYDHSYLDKKDKYSAFISSNNGHVKVYSKTDTKRETLVLIKDSFGNSLAPFLAAHFDLEIIDLRYYTMPVADVIDGSGAKKVLVMYNLDSLVSATNLTMLTFGQ